MIYPQYPDDQRESRFTHPKDFCRNPHLWHSADPDSTEYEVIELVAAFVRALQPEIVVETGSAFGYGSQAIGAALQANGHGELYSLEIDPKRVQIARTRIIGLPVHIVQGDSLQWTPPAAVQFAFFDSFPEHRCPEFLRYRPFMERGTVVAFHDAAPHHAVWNDIQTLEAQGVLKAIRLRTPRGIAFAEVL